MEDFLAAVRPYFNHYPFMSPSPNGELDGNAILYAGTYGLLHHKLFGEYKNSAEHSCLLYKDSYVPERPGVLTRGPHKWEDPQTHDDYIGMCTLSSLNHGGAANAVYLHGKRHWWFYRRGTLGGHREWFNALFWRLPGVVQHFKICAGVRLTALDMLFFSLGVYFNSRGDQRDTSGKILRWHMVAAYTMGSQKNWLCDWAVRRWVDALRETYPNGMGDVFKIYYGANHPFVTFARGIV